MSHRFLPYDPGVIPTKEGPQKGDVIAMTIHGLPPIKSTRESLRNPSNKKYERFANLREVAIKAMGGRSWYFGGVKMDIEIYKNKEDDPKVTLNEYVGGIMDTLDGSSGVHFTYLPIVYEDDSQVVDTKSQLNASNQNYYTIQIEFL